ncbi:DUF4326 domain-containing protein [Gloeobacter kilaueensis]|uniref:DUF4326 domain-containing protein n=1 Tax=Gloeobacter kilaueensis (strain ATCC BAA-2537 / CCAP 1431/1 / ULC 316 / JS1) TaxID=1183438 RepID=U5QNB4_GLOK1|nr:DUF4326 domain-containing protein [Gloeobacter kilaueensis]AGY60353.1 hypothetical protein GKIL_4107 [Gloeobacter kilaueensis JS1]
MQIRVINKHYEPVAGEYIGRPSVLGNPFVLGQDGNRQEVIEKYRRWLWQKLKQGGPVLDELCRLQQLAYQRELVLVCWCKRPDREVACHGDVLKQAIEWLDRRERGVSEPGVQAQLPNAVAQQLSLLEL